MANERRDNQIETNIEGHQAFIVRTTAYNKDESVRGTSTEAKQNTIIDNQEELQLTTETSQQDLLERILAELKILNMHMSFVTDENIGEVSDD